MKPPPKKFTSREGRLVSIGFKAIAGVRSELARPERAIFIVTGFRRVLLDKDGAVSNKKYCYIVFVQGNGCIATTCNAFRPS
jgi:hypothetical protein